MQQTELPVSDCESIPGNQRPRTSTKWLLTGLIVAVCLVVAVVYWPVLSAKAISFDDDMYFIDNPLVRNPGWESARRFLSEVLEPSTVAGYYQPLTMISLMLDHAIASPEDYLGAFHRTSLVLHITNTTLIIVILYLLFGRVWAAVVVGLLFGVHPLTVEPVSWIGERKTLLAAFFTLWSLVFYLRFVRAGKRRFPVWSLVMYVLALLSKPTSTPLPAMMLLLDYWPLRRLKLTSVPEKLPFFAIGGISAVITYISQNRTVSILTPEAYGPTRVPLVFCHNIIFYLWKMVWPSGLTSHHPFPEPMDLSQPAILAGVIGTCLLIPALVISLRWTRAALTGWLIFFIMVLPTMQALQFCNVIVCDKFVYLPSIGILIILAAFLGWILNPQQRPRTLIIRYCALAIVVTALACGETFATRQYLGTWRDSISLWSNMVDKAPAAAPPRDNLGVAYAEAGNLDMAITQFATILEMDPNDYDAHFNIGNILSHKGNFSEAVKYYEEAIRLKPRESAAYLALGTLLADEGNPEQATALFRNAIEKGLQKPYLLHKGLGAVLLKTGQIDEAIAELETAAGMKADSTIYGNLGLALSAKGDNVKAMEYLNKAIRLNPANAEAHFNLGNSYLIQGRLAEAINEYEMAINTRPDYVKAYSNLAVALAQTGWLDKAIENFRRVAELDPNNPDAHFNLATALAEKGLINEAITEYEQVLKIDPDNADAQAELKKAKEAQAALQPVNP